VDKQAQRCTWLHLTDLHFGGRPDNTYWPVVKAELWKDLQNPPVAELRTPDIVFFTGDLSFSGQKYQFDDVARFLDELRDKVGNVPVVAVPGNHDLVRPQDTAQDNIVHIQWRDDEDKWIATAREQERIVAELTQGSEKSLMRMAVFSLSPIPLTIHLGYCLSSRIEVKTFQYHNHNDRHSWRWPENPAHVDTEITTHGLPDARILEKCEGVIRISLSALIHPEETEEVVPKASFSVDLQVRTPSTTWLVAPSQVEAVRRGFRDVLGQIRGLVPQCERLHLFYAGPPPGAIVVGQEINPRMNPQIVLYEYARSAIPRYRAVLTLPVSP